MKDEELILKAVEYCNDIPARVKDFLRQTDTQAMPLKPEPEFKVGAWYVFPEDHSSYFDNIIYRVNEIRPYGYVYFDTSDDTISTNNFKIDSQFAIRSRLATPKEIESHLIKIATGMGLNGGVKLWSFYDDLTPYIKDTQGHAIKGKASYNTEKDSLITDDGLRLYCKGKWATIISEKKKLPKTKEDFGAFLGAYCNRHTSSVDEFLKDYED